jgi:hypothetical protein
MMKGSSAKQGVTSTLEKLWSMSGRDVKNLSIIFSGKGAKVSLESKSKAKAKDKGKAKDKVEDMVAKVYLPAIDERSDVPAKLFNNLIAYVLHEFGHILFTENDAAIEARKRSKFLFDLINVLEDVRIEKRLIDSGFAGNAHALFEGLVNGMLVGGEPDILRKENVPITIAVEGRRLNGYSLECPDLLADSPWCSPVSDAICSAKDCTCTAEVVMVATDLFERIGDIDSEGDGGGMGGDEEGEEGGEEGGEGGEGGDKPKKPKKGGGRSHGSESEGESRKPEISEGGESLGGGGGSSGKTMLEPAKLIEIETRKTDKGDGIDVTVLPARKKPTFMKFNWES